MHALVVRARAPRTLTLTLLLAATLAQSSCGGEAPTQPINARTGGKADAVGAAPALTFDAAWNETASAPLVAGGSFRIIYDEARLPHCRASHNGNPGWNITAFARFAPSGKLVERELFVHPAKPDGSPDYYGWVQTQPVIAIPGDATAVELWFKNRSAYHNPCVAWDSNYGKNYRFPVTATPRSTLRFDTNWRIDESGARLRGGKLLVRYDVTRLERIARGTNGTGDFFQQTYGCFGHTCCSLDWDNSAFVRFHGGGAFSEHALGDSSVQELVLEIPQNASRVELYFRTRVTTRTQQCIDPNAPIISHGPDTFYDSNFARNFIFSVQ